MSDIRGMESAIEIENLIYRYGELIDAGEFDAIGEHMKHATLTAEGTEMHLQGPKAIAGNYHHSTRIYPDTGTPKTKHVFTNPQLEIDEAAGTATGKTYYTVFQQTDVLPLQAIITGRYRHAFARIDGKWEITEKHFYVDQVGDMSQHLLMELDDAQKR